MISTKIKFKIIIPARYSSSRFKGKLLKKINGLSLIEHTYLKAKRSDADNLIIATDSSEIEKIAKNFGAEVFYSQKKHSSGSERIAEVALEKKWIKDEIIINLQADEPFIHPNHINQLAQYFYKKQSEMATLCSPAKEKDWLDNDIVKLVKNQSNEALYFSRANIPNLRADFLNDSNKINLRDKCIFRHIGIYAFKASFLQKLVNYSVCQLEEIESLEQLRALYYAHKIDVLEVGGTEFDYGIDNKKQLEFARNHRKK